MLERRRYTVKLSVPLEIDTTTMVLDGPQFYPAPAPYAPPFEKTGYAHPNAHQSRGAEGGVEPYEYSSSNPSVASVDSKTGHVVSTGNGTAHITVSDKQGDSVGYDVITQNVYELVCNRQSLTIFQAEAWIASIGAKLLLSPPDSESNNPLAKVISFSFQTGALTGYYWCCPMDPLYPEAPGADVAVGMGLPARWTPPFQAGIRGIGQNLHPNTNPVIGYRPRN